MVGTRCASTTSLVVGLAIVSAAHGSFLDPFEYAGGQETLLGLMQNGAGNGLGEAGVFASAGFGSNMVNMFLADLSNSASGKSDAGLPLSVMRGHSVDLHNKYSAFVSITNMFDVGEDGSFTAGLSEIFAIGEGVSIVGESIRLTGNQVDSGSVDPTTQTTRRFASTSLRTGDEHELSLAFLSLGGSIQTVGLFNDDDPTTLSSIDRLNIGPPPIMPLPPPLGLALAGLIGVVLFRRRMAS